MAFNKWVCIVCGYVYDEELGDPDHGIAAGTRWEDVPDDWECPECGLPLGAPDLSCPRCGQSLEDASAPRCGNCGLSLAEVAGDRIEQMDVVTQSGQQTCN